MAFSFGLIAVGYMVRMSVPISLFIFIAGGLMMSLFIMIDSITTENFFNGSLDATYHYRQESVSGLSDISAGATSFDIKGEYVTNTLSALYGDTIDCIDITLRKLGAPTGVVDIGVWDHAQAIGNPVIQHFGAQDLSVVSASVSQWYTFCLPEGTTYTIGDQDVIGARYNAGDSSNAVRIQVSTIDVFDSTNSQLTQKADATDVWSQSTGDIVMRLYLRGADSEIITNDYEFTQEVKTFMVLMASMMLLVGAMVEIEARRR